MSSKLSTSSCFSEVKSEEWRSLYIQSTTMHTHKYIQYLLLHITADSGILDMNIITEYKVCLHFRMSWEILWLYCPQQCLWRWHFSLFGRHPSNIQSNPRVLMQQFNLCFISPQNIFLLTLWNFKVSSGKLCKLLDASRFGDGQLYIIEDTMNFHSIT